MDAPRKPRSLLRERVPGGHARVAYVVITDQGREAIEKAAPSHLRTVRRLVFDVLTPSELAGFEVAVDKLLAATQAEDSTP